VRLARGVHQGQGEGQGERVLVPGYRLGRVLGVGAGGPVWAAVRESDQLAVAVKIVDPTVTREAAVLRGLDHPHVVRLLSELALGDGRLALILERVGGGSLARVVAARGHLTAAETATVLVTLGTTLADLHRLGVTHGDLSPGNVLFHTDGRPMLADLGAARVAGLGGAVVSGTPGFTDPALLAGEPAGPRSDAYALAALGWFCLVGSPPPAPIDRTPLSGVCPTVPTGLAAAIDAGLEPEPEARIGAGELAWLAYDAAAPAPVALAAGTDPASELTHRIRALAAAEGSPETTTTGRKSRTKPLAFRPVRIAMGVTAVIGLVLSTGLVVARSSASAAPQWATILAGLSVSRAAAFAEPSRGPAAFDVPGSPAWLQDEAALKRLATTGLHYEHLSIAVGRIQVQSASDGRARLRVAVGPSAYDVVGGPVHHEPAGAVAVVVLTLRRLGSGWRVFSVSR
jgi:protein kinase-like protein